MEDDDITKLIDQFASLRASHGDGLTDLETPLKRTLGALVLAEDYFGISYLSIEEIHAALESVGWESRKSRYPTRSHALAIESAVRRSLEK
jgi:hypothetical protein